MANAELPVSPAPNVESLALEAKGRRVSARWAVPWAVVTGLLLVWQGLTVVRAFPPMLLPSPIAVVQQALSLFSIGYGGQTLWTDIWVSTVRIATGFVAAVLIGVPVGLAMAASDPVFQAVDPILQFLRPVPPLAYIPLLVAWFGIGELPKVILILLGTLPIIIISTISGVRGTPRHRIQAAQCLGATPLQVFRHVILPSALPEVFTGMRVGIGVAWTCLVAAEIVAASAGLGWLIQYAGQEIQIGIIFVGIVAIGILGYSMELIIRMVERAVVPWKGKV